MYIYTREYIYIRHLGPDHLGAHVAQHDISRRALPGRCEYLSLIDSCITQLEAQGPSRTCNGSTEEEEEEAPGKHATRFRSPLPPEQCYILTLSPLPPV